ncbi:MAG: class I SAM-dependent methyltransferase [Rhizobiales bacterium]|nr:class I SAM-dependent methyltransferase [Hyphomicrobiales bacterium]
MANWDERYAGAPHGLFGDAPNEYVREVTARSDFRARSALVLADGDGRNGRHLAGLGFAVTAVDLSVVGTRNAFALDAARGVALERIVADLDDWSVPAGRQWDSVFLLYLQAPAATRVAALRLGWQALAPGGIFVLEGFARTLEAEAMGPGPEELRYDLDEIIGALTGAEIIEALAGRVRLDEGLRHTGLAQVVRYCGRKPAAAD